MPRKLVSRIRSASTIGSRSKPLSQNHWPKADRSEGKGLWLRSHAQGQRGNAEGLPVSTTDQRFEGPMCPLEVISSWAPARKPSAASPVQSANSVPHKRTRWPVTTSCAADGFDVPLGGFHTVDAPTEQQLDVFFRPHDVDAPLVLIDFGRAGVGAVFRVEFGDDVTHAGPGLQVSGPVQPHADLGTVVAGQHRAILHQGHAEAEPDRRERRTCPPCRRPQPPGRTCRRLSASRAGRAVCGAVPSSPAPCWEA